MGGGIVFKLHQKVKLLQSFWTQSSLCEDENTIWDLPEYFQYSKPMSCPLLLIDTTRHQNLAQLPAHTLLYAC